MPSRPRILIIQGFPAGEPPAWIARCLASVKGWAAARGHDYILTDERAHALCGEAYLAQAAGDARAIMALARLELMRVAHEDGYERTAWFDADIFVFDPDRLALPKAARLTVGRAAGDRVIVACQNDADLDRLARAVRERADAPTPDATWDAVGRIDGAALAGLAAGDVEAPQALALAHGAPVRAASLEAAQMPEAQCLAAMDALEQTRGAVVNQHLPPPVY